VLHLPRQRERARCVLRPRDLEDVHDQGRGAAPGHEHRGRAALGPSGSGIWSAPTIDATRRLVYVGTGNTYSAPAQASSDAVVALDLDTGSIRWMKQVTPNDVYVTNCRAGNPNCPEAVGPDVDFGSPPMLARVNGRDVIVIGQKSGVGYAMDPDHKGKVIWQYRAGKGGTLGGMEWGGAVDEGRAYFAVSDIQQPEPGGLHAVNIGTGQRAWLAQPPSPVCGSGTGCNAAQSAAITIVPGVIFSGSNDGALRAYSTKDGAILWQYDTNREFGAVNGVPATGASLIGPGPVVAVAWCTSIRVMVGSVAGRATCCSRSVSIRRHERSCDACLHVVRHRLAGGRGPSHGRGPEFEQSEQGARPGESHRDERPEPRRGRRVLHEDDGLSGGVPRERREGAGAPRLRPDQQEHVLRDPAGSRTSRPINHVGIHVENMAAATAMFKARGVNIAEIRTSDTKAILNNITDPNGIRIELAELPPESMHRKR